MPIYPSEILPLPEVTDPSKARVVLHSPTRVGHAPLDKVGLLTTAEAAATYVPVDGSTPMTGPLKMPWLETLDNGMTTNLTWDTDHWEYIADGYGTYINETNGNLLFQQAASGTAGATATLTDTLSLGANVALNPSGNDGNLVLSGGTASDNPNIQLYGKTHASYANRAYYDATVHTFRAADHSTTFLTMDATNGTVAASSLRGTSVVATQATAGTENAHFQFLTSAAAHKGWFYCDNNHYIHTVTSNGHTFSCMTTGVYRAAIGYQCRTGGNGAFAGNFFNFYWAGSGAIYAYIDNSYIGTLQMASDYRIKKDVEDLTPTWDQVKALRPISYTPAEFQPTMSKQRQKVVDEQKEKDRKVRVDQGEFAPEEEEAKPLFSDSDIKQWGFIAHEVQKALLPSAASGEKDMEDGVQSLNLAPILAATVKALQEAMARIEALEEKLT